MGITLSGAILVFAISLPRFHSEDGGYKFSEKVCNYLHITV